MSSEPSKRAGWRVRRSIALELDAATHYVRLSPATLPKSLIELALSVPATWIDEFETFGSATSADDRYTFEYLARWAEVEQVEDYDAASGAMREITIDEATNQVATASGLEPAVDLEPTERLIDLELRLYAQIAPRFGLYPASDDGILEQERDRIVGAVQVLRGGPLHSRFWHWMDRFCYEVYLPWRTTRLGAIAALEQNAIKGLGGEEGTGFPDLEWLPSDNILIAIPTAREAVEAGGVEIVFWAEPFGLSSALVGAPGVLFLSFAEHGIDLEYSTTVRDDLTAKLKALADPTRISILRMIRNIDADNTQIAGFLDVSRPTVSVHAKMLADAGLITTEREGRQARHSFHPDAVRQLCAELLRYLDVAENPDP